MADLKSYEEFEKEFKENEQDLTPVEQARKERIFKVLNQVMGESDKYGYFAIKTNLENINFRMEEIQIIEELHQKNLIIGQPTNDAYSHYEKMCKKCGFNAMNQIAFSKFVIRYFEVKIINKKVCGKKYRLFVSEFNVVQCGS